MTPEGKVKLAIKRVIKAEGWAYVMPMGTGFGTAGASDFIVCARGVFLAIEAKASGKHGNTTKLQDKFRDEVNNSGGVYVVISTTDMDQIRSILSAIVSKNKVEQWK